MAELNLTVIEDNDPLITFALKDKAADGTTTATNLTGASVELYIKDTKSTEESANGVIKYSTATGEITIQSPATNGKLDVQFAAANLGTPGKKRYRLDVIRNSKRVTYAYGTITITDV